MYRNFQQTNNNNISSNLISSDKDNDGGRNVIFDVDEIYEFSGASLKLRNSTSGSDIKNTKVVIGGNSCSSSVNNTSSILSGTDVLSPPIPGTPQHYNVRNSNSSKTVIMDGQSNGLNVVNDDFSIDSNKAITSVDPTKPKIGSPRHFFCFRQGLFEQAVNDCITILLKPSNDVELQGSWLLTEISHWDHEKETIVILTSKSLLAVKFDFIALRILEHRKIHLNKVDTIAKGKLSYPSSSIVPHVEGITNGLSAIFRGALFVRRTKPQTCTQPISTPCTSGFKIAEKLNFSKFHPIERSEIGVRLMWNNGQTISTTLSWNPFTRDIPWKTFTNHPLFSYQEEYLSVPSSQEQIDHDRLIYSIDNFHYALVRLFTTPSLDSNVNKNCKFNEEPIVSQNYVGLGAMIHNRNNLGFFKVRGKFSF